MNEWVKKRMNEHTNHLFTVCLSCARLSGDSEVASLGDLEMTLL